MRVIFLLSIFFGFTFFSFAKDWPKFGGENGDFISDEKGLLKDWKDKDPEILWKYKAGLGFSSVVESRGYAYSQGYSEGKNTIFCLDSRSGKLEWKKTYPCPIGDNYFKGGSRSTPIVADGSLYLLSHQGDFYCLDAISGKVKWSLSLVDDLGGIRPTWGYASSPLLYNETIIFNTGAEDGSIVALDSSTGKILWRTGHYPASYSSILKRRNLEQFLLFHAEGVSLHNISNGMEIASYQHKTRYGINAAQPVEINRNFLVSSAYGKGTAFVDFSSTKPKAIWKSSKVASQISTPVSKDDFIYGIHGQAGARSKFSTLFCMNSSNGKVIWQQRGYGLGTIILVDDTLVVLSDQGELALVEATPQKYTELFRMQVLGGKENWIPPTYANGRMHCRSSDGDWVCLAMSEK